MISKEIDDKRLQAVRDAYWDNTPDDEGLYYGFKDNAREILGVEITKDQARIIFNLLPDTIIGGIIQWGSGDSVYRDEIYGFFKEERVLILNALGVSSDNNEYSTQPDCFLNPSSELKDVVFKSEEEKLFNDLIYKSIIKNATGLYIGVRNDTFKISPIINNEFPDSNSESDCLTIDEVIKISKHISENICKGKLDINSNNNDDEVYLNTFTGGAKPFKLYFKVLLKPTLGGFDLIIIYIDFEIE